MLFLVPVHLYVTITHFRWEHEVSLRDVDGSLTGTAGSIVTPHNPSLPSSCVEIAGFDVGTFKGSSIVALKSVLLIIYIYIAFE